MIKHLSGMHEEKLLEEEKHKEEEIRNLSEKIKEIEKLF